MSTKILFLDDIFSDQFRRKLSSEHLAFDDGWVSAVTKTLTNGSDDTGRAFQVIKSGDLVNWRALVEKEKPDVVLLDCFWPELALAKFGDTKREAEVGLSIIPEMRKTFPELPIICYTVKPNEDLIDRAYRLGASFFLEKVPLAMPEVQSPLKYVVIYLLRQRNAARE
ncbi:MAG: response regulator [Desulfomonilaceae bacterium]|nr:response regulator [Desulfomonilaceae bacterium]